MRISVEEYMAFANEVIEKSASPQLALIGLIEELGKYQLHEIIGDKNDTKVPKPNKRFRKRPVSIKRH